MRMFASVLQLGGLAALGVVAFVEFGVSGLAGVVAVSAVTLGLALDAVNVQWIMRAPRRRRGRRT